VNIGRQWNDWRIAEVDLSDISNLHWDNISGGVYARARVYACAPRNFIHGYVNCDSYNGDLAHSCVCFTQSKLSVSQILLQANVLKDSP
jgi:hypothetical protein